MTVKHIQQNKLTWINIDKLDKETAIKLRNEFKFHPLDLKDCLGESQQSKIDIYRNYVFLTLDFPLFEKTDNRVMRRELNIFLTESHVITIQKHRLKPLIQMFYRTQANNRIKKKFFDQGSSALLLYYILDGLYHETFPILDHFRAQINGAEELIYNDKLKKALPLLADIRRNNLNIRAMIGPQRHVIRTLSKIDKKWFKIADDSAIYFDDIGDYLEKNWTILANHKELIDGLYQTNESFMVYKTNTIIMILTLFSVALLPLTLLSGIYGMNISLPFSDAPNMIWLMFASLILIILAIIAYLKWKDWI